MIPWACAMASRIRIGMLGTRHGHAPGKWLALCTNTQVETAGIYDPDPLDMHRFPDAHWLGSARELLEDLGLRLEWGGMAQGFFFVEMLAGDPGAAERELRRGYEILHGLGEKSYLSTLAAMLAHALYAQGRYEEAEQFARISGEAAGAEDLTSNIMWRSARAKLLARRGDLDGALGLIGEARSLAERTDFLNIQADVQADRAEVLRLGGRGGEAAEALEEAARLYEKKGNRVAAARAASQVVVLRT